MFQLTREPIFLINLSKPLCMLWSLFFPSTAKLWKWNQSVLRLILTLGSPPQFPMKQCSAQERVCHSTHFGNTIKSFPFEWLVNSSWTLNDKILMQTFPCFYLCCAFFVLTKHRLETHCNVAYERKNFLQVYKVTIIHPSQMVPHGAISVVHTGNVEKSS